MTAEIEIIRENRKALYPESCPFENKLIKNQGWQPPECMHCYNLFPGWAETYIDRAGKRSMFTKQHSFGGRHTRGVQSACPCHVLGEEAVMKIIKLKEAEHGGRNVGG